MKKFLSVVFSIMFLCNMIFLPVNAISVNHSEVFYKECNRLWWGMLRYDDISYDTTNYECGKYTYDIGKFELHSGAILTYILSKYDFESHITTPTTVSAEWFENTVTKHFANIDFNLLLDNPFLSYNESEQTYDLFNFLDGGWSLDFHFIGYTMESNNRYTIYGCTIDNAYEKPDNAVEGKDYITVLDYENKLRTVELLATNKIQITYENGDLKFHSWENISNMPNISNLITYDTKIDASIESTSSNTQSNTTQSSTSNPNTSNQSQPQNSSAGSADSTSSKSSTSTTSALQNTISSHKDITSQTDTGNSSNTTYTKTSNSANDTIETDKTESTIEDSKQSNATNNSNENHKSNNLNIILTIISVVILLGSSITIYLLKFKRK